MRPHRLSQLVAAKQTSRSAGVQDTPLPKWDSSDLEVSENDAKADRRTNFLDIVPFESSGL